MSKKHRQKNKPPGRIPTGSTKHNVSPSPSKSRTPDPSSAVEKLNPSDSSLAGAAAQSTTSPHLTQNVSNTDLAEETKTPNSETLVTVIQSVPSAQEQKENAAEAISPSPASIVAPSVVRQQSPAEIWKTFVKDATVKLQPKEKPFYLDSGEACVTIPNAVVEKNKKAWEYFILGQFYEDPPARGAIHAIVNGIWSRQRRDITVNKMDGNTFLFRVPDPNARRRILSQSLWQIDGQTMYVAKWSPGVQQAKPELDMVPVWLEFTGVPLQFFNRDALQEIAGIVGHPVCLHPATENLTNIEVAKVYTVIDPRKPLPEFVNARFESGDTRRIAVTSPWLPSLCSFCKKFGHTISRCKDAPRTCLTCNSVRHDTSTCPRTNHVPQASGNRKDVNKRNGKAPIKSLLPIVNQQKMVYKPVDPKASFTPPTTDPQGSKTILQKSQLITTQSPVPDDPLTPRGAPAHQSSCTISTEYDLKEGSLSVDLTDFGDHGGSQKLNNGSSSDISLSEEEDNLDDGSDGSDKFIEVFSKRMQKQTRSKEKARARGPLIL